MATSWAVQEGLGPDCTILSIFNPERLVIGLGRRAQLAQLRPSPARKPTVYRPDPNMGCVAFGDLQQLLGLGLGFARPIAYFT